MNTGEVSNGAVISANTVGNVDASKLPGAISPTIVHEERKVNGKTSGSTGGRVAAGIVRGSPPRIKEKVLDCMAKRKRLGEAIALIISCSPPISEWEPCELRVEKTSHPPPP